MQGSTPRSQTEKEHAMNAKKLAAVPAKNLTTVVTVDQTPEAVYAAINDVRGWWSGEVDGTTDKLGGEFTYRYKDIHYSKQKVTELVPGKKVTWQVLDSFLTFIDDKTEWNGTTITFDIAPKGGKTEIRFTHVGLTPQVECFSACSDGWGFLIKQSLPKLIATGKGQPFEKESGKQRSSASKR
jgi:hypothetical protein